MDKNSLNTDIFDLDDMSLVLREMLSRYADLFRPYVSFGDFEPLTETPEKNYTARTEVPVFCDKQPAGTLYAVCFGYRDGTGNDTAFNPGELGIPPAYSGIIPVEKILPRSKEGTGCEAFFPFFTALGNNRYARYVASLDELTVDDPKKPKQLVKAGTLGVSRKEYFSAILNGFKRKNPAEPNPPVFMTVGYRDGERFGDPHAVFCPFPSGLQVVGFLAVSQEEASQSSLNLLFDLYGQPPAKYED